MALLTLTELVYMVILTAALGYIFSGFIRKPTTTFEQLYKKQGMDWEKIKLAAIVAANSSSQTEIIHKGLILELSRATASNDSIIRLLILKLGNI